MLKILILLCYVIIYANSYEFNLEHWNKLLHIKDNENMVISDDFYLSHNHLSSAIKELNLTVKYLNSAVGNKVACNFPARYSFLKTENFDIPNYDLKQCKNLNSFIKSFGKEEISLVFSSEYTNDPSSAFGHMLLIFRDLNQSIDVSDVVHFAAVTTNDGFFTYSYKGLTGGYKGYYIREPFFKKKYQYNLQEQRYMHIYKLNYDKKDILQLIYHLYELRKATFKYYFSNRNCASYMSDLLSIVDKNNKDNLKLYYLPIDTLIDYKKHIVGYSKFEPLLNHIYLLLSKMTKKQQKEFYNIVKTNKIPNNNLDDITKEAIVNYYIFYFRKFHISFKNYNDVINLKYKKTIIQDNTVDPLKEPLPSYISFGYQYNKYEKGIKINYRSLYKDIYDFQYNLFRESELSLFDINLLLEKNDLQLTSLKLISIKSFDSDLRFYTPLSWQLYSGINRENIDNKLLYNNEIGVGITKCSKLNIKATLLMNLGLNNFEPYIKPSIYLISYPYKNIKLTLHSFYEYTIKENYYSNVMTLSYKINFFTYSFHYKNTNNKMNKTSVFDIKYNF
jgi:hypothetical protein